MTPIELFVATSRFNSIQIAMLAKHPRTFIAGAKMENGCCEQGQDRAHSRHEIRLDKETRLLDHPAPQNELKW